TMTAPLVYVLIINWNGMEHVEACFTSLFASTYANVKFLLIDNASTDGSLAYVREHFKDPRLEILALPENLGWSGGNNAGIRYAQARDAEFLFLLNNDTWTAADCLERLVDQALGDETIGLLAPKMVLYDTPCVLNSLGL